MRWWWGGGRQNLQYMMTTFSLYSFRFKNISQYISFKSSLAGFWRPPPGGARGQLPPPPRYATD